MQPQRKGFFIRLAALAIDMTIGGMLAVILIAFVTPIFTAHSGNGSRLPTTVFWGLALLYSCTEIFSAQTIGKAILRLSIAKSDCTPAEPSRLVSRWMIKIWPVWFLLADAILNNPALGYLGGFGFLLAMISFLSSMNDGKQAWHDQLSGTAIYRTIDVDGPDDSSGGFEVIQK